MNALRLKALCQVSSLIDAMILLLFNDKVMSCVCKCYKVKLGLRINGIDYQIIKYSCQIPS